MYPGKTAAPGALLQAQRSCWYSLGLLGEPHGVDASPWVIAGCPLQVFGQSIGSHYLGHGEEPVLVMDNLPQFLHFAGPLRAEGSDDGVLDPLFKARDQVAHPAVDVEATIALQEVPLQVQGSLDVAVS